MRPVLLASVVVSLAAWQGDSAAEPPPFPVRVTVEGQGTVRVRVAAGTTAPCEASSNEPIFEGELRANEVRELSSRRRSVCVQHTYGAFRQTNWSTPVIVTPRCVRWSGRRCAEVEPFLRVELSTETPFAPR